MRDGRIKGDRVTEKMVAEHLYNPDIPDCDLVIRTSGEQRTSNFRRIRPQVHRHNPGIPRIHRLNARAPPLTTS